MKLCIEFRCAGSERRYRPRDGSSAAPPLRCSAAALLRRCAAPPLHILCPTPPKRRQRRPGAAVRQPEEPRGRRALRRWRGEEGGRHATGGLPRGRPSLSLPPAPAVADVARPLQRRHPPPAPTTPHYAADRARLAALGARQPLARPPRALHEGRQRVSVCLPRVCARGRGGERQRDRCALRASRFVLRADALKSVRSSFTIACALQCPL